MAKPTSTGSELSPSLQPDHCKALRPRRDFTAANAASMREQEAQLNGLPSPRSTDMENGCFYFGKLAHDEKKAALLVMWFKQLSLVFVARMKQMHKRHTFRRAKRTCSPSLSVHCQACQPFVSLGLLAWWFLQCMYWGGPPWRHRFC